jgi:hypothetical protein
MALTIEMPFEAYRSLIREFDSSSAEFRLLASDYVERSQTQGRAPVVVQIQWETEQAKSLLNTAVHSSPEAAVVIAKALSVMPHNE